MVAFIILKIHLTFVTCILYNFNYTFKQYMYIIYIHTIYTNCSLNMFSYVTYILKSLIFTHPNFKKKSCYIHLKKSGKHFCKFKVKNEKHQYQFLLHVFTLYKTKRCSMFNNINLMNHQFMFNGRQDFEKKFLI